MKTPYVWVVEKMVLGVWGPIKQVIGPDEQYATNALTLWRKANPDDKFRVAKYTRVERTRRRTDDAT